MEGNIRERDVAKTANLLVQQYVFNEIGDFPSHLRSGGDVIWTSRATDEGFDLVFCPDAEVWKPSRGFAGLVKKQYRVGKG